MRAGEERRDLLAVLWRDADSGVLQGHATAPFADRLCRHLLGEAPLLFDCFGCTCDAQVSFCRQVFAGFAGPDLPACPVVPEEGLGSGCVLFPVNCDPPSCACLPTMNNNCFCTEQAPGAFEVTCPLP